VFHCPIVYDNGMAELTHVATGARIQLLETIQGAFTLRVDADGVVEIIDADMHYPGLKRSFKGKGRIESPGHASGRAVSWLKTLGPLSRDHREGAWTLRPAPAEKTQRFLEKRQNLDERRARAEKAGLELD